MRETDSNCASPSNTRNTCLYSEMHKLSTFEYTYSAKQVEKKFYLSPQSLGYLLSRIFFTEKKTRLSNVSKNRLEPFPPNVSLVERFFALDEKQIDQKPEEARYAAGIGRQSGHILFVLSWNIIIQNQNFNIDSHGVWK